MQTKTKQNFYFTYGCSETFPFQKGWTKIEAPNRSIACEIFRAFHPDVTPGLLNCSGIYDEEAFHKTSMWSEGNFGAHEMEVILMQRIVIPNVKGVKYEV